jgi:hypothetical protein
MAERKPLVLIGGQPRELPAGDTVAGASGEAAGVWFGSSAPSDPIAYPLWYDTTTGILKGYNNDGTPAFEPVAPSTASSFVKNFLLMGA